MRQYRKRVDPNQGGIVKALVAMGCSVQPLDGMGGGVPDLLVGYRGANYLFEVKCREQGRVPGGISKFEREHGCLKKTQYDWHTAWCGQVATVWSAEEACKLVSEAQNAKEGQLTAPPTEPRPPRQT